MNIQTNAVEIVFYILIGVPQDGYPMGVEPLIPFPVVLAGCFFIVLAAVQLDHQRL